MKTTIYIPILVILSLILLLACNPARKLESNQYLMASYQVKIDNSKVDSEELDNIVKQKPNKAIIRIGNRRFIRFHLWFYNFANFGKTRKYKNWLKNVIGEEPVLLDTSLTRKSVTQLKLFLNKKGYFNAQVKDETVYKKQQSWVTYTIKSGKPYQINNYTTSISDKEISALVLNDSINSLVKTGINYDEFLLEQERERITKLLRNNGYYYFLKEYIHFDADSSLGSNSINLTLRIKNPEKKIPDTDSIIESTHYKYWLDKIYIEPDFVPKQKFRIYNDTTEYINYLFLYDRQMRYRKKILVRPFFLTQGDMFCQENIDETYKLMGNLKAFKFINVVIKENTSDSLKHLLNAFVQLTPSPKQSFSVSGEGTYNSGNFGVSGNLIYQNKNVFKGAEIFEVKLKGGLEVQNITTNDGIVDGIASTINPFNIYQIGPEFSLNFPRIIFPLPEKIKIRNLKPKTQLVFSYDYQKRPEYNGTIANFSFNYTWRPFKQKFIRLTFTPSEINFVKVFLDDDFRDKLINSGNPISIKRYDPLFVNSIQFNLIYNNQDLVKVSNFSYFRFDIETGGNIPTFYNNLIGTEKTEDGAYQKFGIKYAQYWKTNADYRFYRKTGALSKLVARTFLGFGQPYGNSKVLPFVKSFYGGGVNDIRAWKTRRLGPGSLPNDYESLVDQTGDMKIEFNLEYRYNVYKYLNAATFVDAGNIWLLKKDENAPGANFTTQNFIRDMALGAGFGLRFDFSFFVIRLDAAYPVYDPAYAQEDRWLIKNPQLKEITVNFGIGYPF
ncbi:MAG: BamA/TamA family outer membrane protein [Bacteroidia bacterium]|nr:BamA/TamA family outer membrane protein [Bacteroidota bacterium]MBP6413573.1 BamA/TamA family outer membrane protein [Bacteroidia bacterium]